MTTSLSTPADETTGVFDPVVRAIEEVRAGRPVVVVDDEDRENEGDLILAAELATPETLAFLVRHTSGYVCAPLTGEECDRLGLPPMAAVNEDRRGTAYTVTVDASEGIGTGISASTPAGRSPASRARSTAASVCPARRMTPPGTARSGTMWPGRRRSPGWVAGSASSRTVRARSVAEIPVPMPSLASTVTV